MKNTQMTAGKTATESIGVTELQTTKLSDEMTLRELSILLSCEPVRFSNFIIRAFGEERGRKILNNLSSRLFEEVKN